MKMPSRTDAFVQQIRHPAVQPHHKVLPRRRKRRCALSMILTALLLVCSSAFLTTTSAGDPLPKMVRKGWGKASVGAVYDSYVTVARPLLVNLLWKAQRIGYRFLYPEYTVLGRAWFNALVVDLSEYILRRSTGVSMEGERTDSDTSGRTPEMASHSGTRWSAASPAHSENGYQASKQVAPPLRPSRMEEFDPPGTPRAEDLSPADGEVSSSSGQILRLNRQTILRWKEVFEDIFMGVAKTVLPRNVLELVKSVEENQYAALRPTLEHALYMTLTKFYPTLMSTGTSEAILPAFHVAVSSDTCPFSLYTSYTFMALIAAGRSGVDALFLADEMMQHYKNDEPYTSSECKAFNEDMREALILDSMTLYELVGRTAGAPRKSFYSLRDLVSLQKATLLGSEAKAKDDYQEGGESQLDTDGEAALREMVIASSPPKRNDDQEGGNLSPRFIAETFKRVKDTARKSAPTNAAPASVSSENTAGEDPLATLILESKSSLLSSLKGLAPD